MTYNVPPTEGMQFRHLFNWRLRCASMQLAVSNEKWYFNVFFFEMHFKHVSGYGHESKNMIYNFSNWSRGYPTFEIWRYKKRVSRYNDTV